MKKRIILLSLVVAGVLFSGCGGVQPSIKIKPKVLTKEEVKVGNGVLHSESKVIPIQKSEFSYSGAIWVAPLGEDKSYMLLNIKDKQLPAGKYQINALSVKNHKTNQMVMVNTLYYIAKNYNNPVVIDIKEGKESCVNADITVAERVQNSFIMKFIVNWIESGNINTICKPNRKYILPINKDNEDVKVNIGFDDAVGLGYVKIIKNNIHYIYYSSAIGKSLIEQKIKIAKGINPDLLEEFKKEMNTKKVIEQNEYFIKYLNGNVPAGAVE